MKEDNNIKTLSLNMSAYGDADYHAINAGLELAQILAHGTQFMASIHLMKERLREERERLEADIAIFMAEKAKFQAEKKQAEAKAKQDAEAMERFAVLYSRQNKRVKME